MGCHRCWCVAAETPGVSTVGIPINISKVSARNNWLSTTIASWSISWPWYPLKPDRRLIETKGLRITQDNLCLCISVRTLSSTWIASASHKLCEFRGLICGQVLECNLFLGTASRYYCDSIFDAMFSTSVRLHSVQYLYLGSYALPRQYTVSWYPIAKHRFRSLPDSSRCFPLV